MDEKVIKILEEIRDMQKEYLDNQKKVFVIYEKQRKAIVKGLFVIIFIIVFLYLIK